MPSGNLGAQLVLDQPHVAHNTYLQMFAETGIVGLALLIGVILAALRATWAATRTFERLGDLRFAALTRTLLIAQVAVLIASVFLSNAKVSQRTWILLGLGPAALAIAFQGLGEVPVKMASQMESTISPPPEGFPPTPEHSPASALASYLRGIMRHRWLFAAVVFAAVLGAAAWIAQRTPTYEARAEILVTPISASDISFVGLPLIRASDLEPEQSHGHRGDPALVERVATEAAESVGGGDPAVSAAGMSDRGATRIRVSST